MATINGNDIAALQAAGAAVTTTANGLVADFGGKTAPELDLSGCSNLTIQNAVFTNTTYGINADSCSNLTIANDTFSQTGAGILVNGSQNTTVTSCHFNDMTAGFQQGGGLVGDWAQFTNSTGVNLTNNTATNGPASNPEDGFNFYNTTGVPGFDQISGNTAGGSNAVGSQSGAILQLENNTSGFTVVNNTFGNSPHDVICLTGANNITIENNHLGIAGDGNPSIQLQGGAGTPVVAGNTDLNLPIADAATAATVAPTPAAATPVDATPIATPTPVDTTPIATPTPVDTTPIATPTPADTTPVDATAVATPTPADTTPVDTTAVATPTPADTTPVDATAVATPTPVDTTPVDATPIAMQTPADTAPADTTPVATNIQAPTTGVVPQDGAVQAANTTPTPADATPTPVNDTADHLGHIFSVINDITNALNSGAVQHADIQAALSAAPLGVINTIQGEPVHLADSNVNAAPQVNANGDASNHPSTHNGASAEAAQSAQPDPLAHQFTAHHDYTFG